MAKELTVGILNDIHWGFPESRDMDDYLAPPLAEAVTYLNDEVEPDVVLGLGDYIQHAATANGDVSRLEAVWDVLSDLNAPFHATLGNHDIVSLEKEAVMDALGPDNDRPFGSVDMHGKRLVSLDTTQRVDELSRVPGLVGERQRDWLEQELDTDRDVYIFSHHLLHYRSMEDTYWNAETPELAFAIDKRDVTDILDSATAPVRAQVAAHIHRPTRVAFHDRPCFTLHAFNKLTRQPGVSDNVGVMTLQDDGFTLETGFQERTVMF